ncbi:MAG TPA: Rieske (2Fe-2S) protein [Candidatus Dormibacteraeota bacterium]|jgi:Rieske Fe-S protein|nr:Rieske (2Fe-2S) protein [Candidatus Dormibacteraeota bacterium]
MALPTLTRRQWLGITAAGSGLITVMLTLPALGFVLSPLFQRQRRETYRVGPVDDIPTATPTALTVGVSSGEAYDTTRVDRTVYVVRRQDGSILALANTCTHMQCNVHWSTELNQFLCPCHGGLYDLEGRNVGGPPPSPLPQWVHELREEDGQTVLYIENRYDESI